MKKTFLFSTIVTVFCALHVVHAASFLMLAPEKTSTNGEPFAVIVYMSPDDSVIGALGGDLVIPNDTLEVIGVNTRSSIVSQWVVQPKYSSMTTNGSSSVIHFEGIMPGGFKGVKGADWQGYTPGVVFSVAVRPKKQGNSLISLLSPVVYAFNKNATKIPVGTIEHAISIPFQTVHGDYSPLPLRETHSNTLAVSVLKESLIDHGRWHLFISEDESFLPIEKVYVYESDRGDPHSVPDEDWKEVVGVYSLKHQDRSKFVHVKVLYENKTFTFVTVPPVDNSNTEVKSSRILIGIIVLSLVVLYAFKKTKKRNKHHS